MAKGAGAGEGLERRLSRGHLRGSGREGEDPDLPHLNGYRTKSVASKVGLPKGGDVTRLTLYEYAATGGPRDGRGRKKEKGRILDEFCETTGLHRKAAIRLLGGRLRLAAVPKKGRPPRYGPEVTEALVKVWEAGDRDVRQAAGGSVAGAGGRSGATRRTAPGYKL